ncbi:hypothetical protein Clacol_003984 [Clathrus columnatus]|uniref:Uncharacterized protein n=1 Tax=Clathrus columnatus TaxID=1419009 RepID=A0AAV5ACX2_9AGAM|nr:hypothetical protein Clacol_003984 [Clathrus columnatus]
MVQFDVLELPEKYRQLPLKGDLYIEYLRLADDDPEMNDSEMDNFFKKNHVVFQIPFKHEFKVDEDKDDEIMGVRISMDFIVEDDMNDIERERLSSLLAKILKRGYKDMEMFKHYFPGILHVKILGYDAPSTAAIKFSVFTGLDFATLGDFVDFLIIRNLHQMFFLGYGRGWKGCRDFIMQTFVQLRLENKVEETDEEGRTLRETITRVYQNDGSSHPKLIDRGLFLTYTPIYPDDIGDAYEPEDAQDALANSSLQEPFKPEVSMLTQAGIATRHRRLWEFEVPICSLDEDVKERLRISRGQTVEDVLVLD